MSSGISPQTPLGELTALPDPLAGFKRAVARQAKMERELGEGGRGKGKNGEGRERGKLGE